MNNPSHIHICSRCILPDTFPGISFDENGLCIFCQTAITSDNYKENIIFLKAKMSEIINKVRGISEYDCVVAFSGGKDSSYTLKLLVEKYNLRCLAITIDNGFISEQAIINCKTITEELGTDLLIYTPSFDFMKNMFAKSITSEDIHSKSAIKRASTVCNSCINLIKSPLFSPSIL